MYGLHHNGGLSELLPVIMAYDSSVPVTVVMIEEEMEGRLQSSTRERIVDIDVGSPAAPVHRRQPYDAAQSAASGSVSRCP